MSPLENLELKVFQALPGLSLKPTLERAAEVGGLLVAARELVPHGEWIRWLKRFKLSRSSAHEYVAVWRHLDTVAPDVRTAGHITIRRFLETIRLSKYAEREVERRTIRDDIARERGKLDDRVELVHADARQHTWPDEIDAVWTDPPWTAEALPLYDWLGDMAVTNLKAGGILGVQCGTNYVAEVIRRIERPGIRFIWLLTFSFSQSSHTPVSMGRFRATVRPILLFCRGEFARSGGTVTDAFVVAPKDQSKPLHPWQQPLGPHQYFLSGLLPVGALVADPFAGSGTTGEAALRAGLRFVGAEQDEVNYRVARGRLARVQQELKSET